MTVYYTHADIKEYFIIYLVASQHKTNVFFVCNVFLFETLPSRVWKFIYWFAKSRSLLINLPARNVPYAMYNVICAVIFHNQAESMILLFLPAANVWLAVINALSIEYDLRDTRKSRGMNLSFTICAPRCRFHLKIDARVSYCACWLKTKAKNI